MAASIVTRAATAFLNLATVPIFMRVIGPEAFGIMAFVITIQSFLSLFDLGLSATASREVARTESMVKRMNVVKTLTGIYWMTAGAVLVATSFGAMVAPGMWLQLHAVSASEAQFALFLAGIAVAIRWPVALYCGVLQGLERQAISNGWTCAFGILRIGGGTAVAAWLSPSLAAVFAWQAAVSAVEVIVVGRVAWAHLAAGSKYRGERQWRIVRELWGTAVGFSAVGLMGTVGANLDRLLLSHFLPLSELGFYSSVAMLAGAITIIGVAVSTAVFPRLARAYEAADACDRLRHEFESALGLILWPVLPLVCALIVAREPLLHLWLGRSALESKEAVMLTLLVASGFVNACANPFYTGVMATGQARLLLSVNGAIIVLLAGFYTWALPKWGGLAAAIGILFQNVAQLVPVAWRFSDSWPRWSWWKERAKEAAGSAAFLGLVHALSEGASHAIRLLAMAAALLILLMIFALRVPEVRRILNDAAATLRRAT